jgi:hypothetical protein
VTDLADALRADGHGDLAAALEAKELVGRVRQSGRDDLADALEAGDPLGTPTGGTEPEAEQQFGQMLLDGINAAQSPSLEFGNWAEEAAGDGGVAQAPKVEERAVANIKDLQHRHTGAELRVARHRTLPWVATGRRIQTGEGMNATNNPDLFTPLYLAARETRCKP